MEYIKKFKDKYGRLQYMCKCSVCGGVCYYSREIKTLPICVPCQTKRNSKRSREKVEAKIYNQALQDHKKALLDQMKIMWDRFERDKENEPKPDFLSAVALIEVLDISK